MPEKPHDARTGDPPPPVGATIDIRRTRFPYLTDAHQQFSIVQQSDFLTHRVVPINATDHLSVFTAGDRTHPTVLIINALGVSNLMLVNLFKTLARCFFVVSWESRGLPNYDTVAATSQSAWQPEAHCRDMAAILAEFDVHPTYVVTYCSGAYLAAYAIANRRLAPEKLCLISPPLELGAPGERTLYQRNFLPLLPRIANGGVQMARLIRALLKQAAPNDLERLDYELSTINDLPFSNDEWTHRYAQLHAPWLVTNWATLVPHINVETIILHGTSDAMVHPDNARALVSLIPAARLTLITGEGHYGVFKSREMLGHVAKALNIADEVESLS